MTYQEIDIEDDPHDGRLYVVPHEDGVSLIFKEPAGPEREIFMTTAEVQKFIKAASPDTAMCPACLGDGPGSSCGPCGGTGRVPVAS